VVYADEDRIGGEDIRKDPLFKPGWSPELLQSANYLGRAVVYRGPEFNAPDVSSRVRHIPRVLYHRASAHDVERRTTLDMAAPADARLSVIICSRNVKQVIECIGAIRYTASLPIEVLVVNHLDSDNGEAMRRAIEQFQATCIAYRGTFDFARMNNLAATKATAPYLLFVNDDVIVHEHGWDQALIARLARPEIGIAGVILQYPDATVQHAGVVTGMGDAVGHCGRFQKSSDLWPWLQMSRDVSAVTGAMLGIRADLFGRMGGFDAVFPVNYNDVDLCLRVREAGLRVVCLDLGKVVHRESQTRIGGTRHEEREALYKRWAGILSGADEFYSPYLAPMERIALREDGSPLERLDI
jgi:GT2 family glycosyltransferase